MSDEERLLAAIRTHPAEDTPRLMYADWLDENGRPARAEFIRLQIEAAALRWNDPRWEPLGARIEALLRAHAAEWAAPFEAFAPIKDIYVHPGASSGDGADGGSLFFGTDDGTGLEFERGFLHTLHADADALVDAHATGRLGGKLAPPGPNVRASVRWYADTDVWPEMRRALLALPVADWTFWNYEQGQLDWIPHLAADADVAARTVGLNLLADDGGPEVDLSGVFAQRPPLESLELRLGRWAGATIANAGRCGINRTLRELSFAGGTGSDIYNSIADQFRELSDGGPWVELTRLGLGRAGSSAAEARELRPGCVPALRSLSFGWPGGTAAFFDALLSNPAVPDAARILYRKTTWGDFDPALHDVAAKSGGRFVIFEPPSSAS